MDDESATITLRIYNHPEGLRRIVLEPLEAFDVGALALGAEVRFRVTERVYERTERG